MATHKSAIKRTRQNEVRRIRNKIYKTKVRTAVKGVSAAVNEKSAEKAQENLRKAVSLLHKTASKGVIHRGKAARKISRLANIVNQLSAS